jgi:hypothetical protein
MSAPGRLVQHAEGDRQKEQRLELLDDREVEQDKGDGIIMSIFQLPP